MASVAPVPEHAVPEPAAAATMPARVLDPGRNCWCTAHADRIGFLIDGEAYFAAFAAAARAAERTIYPRFSVRSLNPIRFEDLS